MVSREKCLEWSREAQVVPQLVDSTGTYFLHVQALINRAYQEGQRDMRERAAKVCREHNEDDGEFYTWEVIRNMEIE